MEDPRTEFINITPENLATEHLCCIIHSKKPHPGVGAKRAWLADRLPEGHVFRKLNDKKATVFIEYAPLETAWVPVEGENFLYLYCLWVTGEHKGKGYGRTLLEDCIADAKAKGRSGICMLGAAKQKAWLTDQAFAKKHGFAVVDSTSNGYELLALSFDDSVPHFATSAKVMHIDEQALTVYYDRQCPFVLQSLASIQTCCEEHHVPVRIIEVNTLEMAKALPCVFNNWAVFYKGEFVTVNVLSDIERLIRNA